MDDNTPRQKKPVFLYIVITVLAAALAALGILTFSSLNRLTALQAKVNEMQNTVKEISDSAASLKQQAKELEKLKRRRLLPALLRRIKMANRIMPHKTARRRKRECSLLPQAIPSQIIQTKAWTAFFPRSPRFFLRIMETGLSMCATLRKAPKAL